MGGCRAEVGTSVGEGARRSSKGLSLLAAAALVVFVLTALWVESGAASAWDRALLGWAEACGAGTARLAFAITMLGSAWVVATAALVVAIWAHHRGRRAGAGVLLGGALVAQGTNLLLKWMVGRERPDWIAEALPVSPAFPSGHAMVPTVVYSMAAVLLVSMHPRLRVPLAVFIPLLCLSIGASRVLLGVHWPTDVIGGFAAGVFLAALGTMALDAAAAHDERR